MPPSPPNPAKTDTRAEGFPGQSIAVLPESEALAARREPLIGGVLPRAAGYFPHAAGHAVCRDNGLPDALLMLCVVGRGAVTVREQDIAVHAGQAVWLPANTPHTYTADDKQPWSLAWVHIGGEGLVEMEDRLTQGSTQLLLGVSEMEKGAGLIDEVCRCLRPPRRPQDLIDAAAMLRQLLGRLHRNTELGIEPPAPARQRVRQSIEWAMARLDRPIQLTELAGRARLSISRYAELFKQIYGQPPMAYLTGQRINLAVDLLSSTELPIGTIAERVGYDDPLYFSRVFRKTMGVCPRTLRRLLHR